MSWKVKEGHGRSLKVKEGHRLSFLINRLTFCVRKVIGGHERSWMVFTHPWIDISGEKSYVWWGGDGGL